MGPKSSRLSLSYKQKSTKATQRRASISVINASQYGLVNIVESIETYSVIFESRVCGIELIPFDEAGNLGAIIIKNHTEFSKKYVRLQSLLVAINGEVCIDTDYQKILSMIASSARPLTLRFHPPNNLDLSSRHHKSSDLRPSDAMRINDEEDTMNDMQMNKIITPSKLFYKLPQQNGMKIVQQKYTILYHKFCELQQFQRLTQQTVIDKMTDIKRLSAENERLRNELLRVESEQYMQYKDKQIMDNYQLMNHQKQQMKKQNVAQNELIQKLQSDIKQQQAQINKLKKQKQKHAVRKKTYSVAVENRLQNELVTKLNKMNGTDIKIIKNSTPPPSNIHRSRSREKKRHKNSGPISSLLTPSEIVRSKSSDTHKKTKVKKRE